MILSIEKNFTQPIIQGTISPKREYTLVDDYRFEWMENGKRYARTVFRVNPATHQPATTDLASAPDEGPLGALDGAVGIENDGPSDGGAVVHDNSYEREGHFLPGEFQVQQADGSWVDCDEPFPRVRADRLYYHMCILGGMHHMEALIEYEALRVGGLGRGLHWYMS